MLPSTGYFKTINCPFYDSGLCERPYCHFKHVKKGLKGKREELKDLTTLEYNSPEAAELPTAATQNMSADSGGQDGEAKPNAEFLQKLVSEAVKKVLEHQNLLTSSASETSLVTKVVEELKPCTSKSEPATPRGHKTYMPPVGIPSYKPTPISELKKRHIPVPYTPSASRGGAKVQVKRGNSVDDNSRLKRVKSEEQAQETTQEGEVKDVLYSPSSLKYSPSHNGWSDNAKPLYVPSSIDTLPTCGNDYVPTHISTPIDVPHYAPSEKSVSSTEPNYEPEGNPSSMVYKPTIKTELDEEDIGNIDLSTEFDLLDEILNENLEEEKKTEESDVPMANPGKAHNKPKPEPKDESKKTKNKHKVKTDDRVRSHSEPTSSSSHRKEKTESKKEKSRSKSHSSGEKKSQKKADDRHSSSSKSEQKSSKVHKSERKEGSSGSKSQKHKARDESRSKSSSKDRHSHHSKEKISSSSKSHSKGKAVASSSISKPQSPHRKSKYVRDKYHWSSKQYDSKMAALRKSYVEGTKPRTVTSPEHDSGSFTDNSTGSNVEPPPSPEATDSDDSVTQECYRIFKEYEPQQSQRVVSKKAEKVVDEPEMSVKRRIAHEAAAINPPQLALSTKCQVNPMQVMGMRIQKLRELQEKKGSEGLQLSSASCPGPSTTTGGRVRIAHVPNVSLLLSAKSRMQAAFEKRRQEPPPSTVTSRAFSHGDSGESHTIVSTVPRGGQRIAHTPSASVLSHPKIVGDLGGKIPANVRQSYLNHIVSEYLKVYSNSAEAYTKATEEEAEIYNRSTTRSVYSSHMSNKINRLRKEGTSLPPSYSSSRVFSHSSILAGHSGTKGSWSIRRHSKSQGSKIATEPLFTLLAPYIMSEEQLISNGYPCPHPEEKGVAIVHITPGLNTRKPDRKRLQRFCCRCNQSYTVNKNGFQVKEEPCVYHWGRMFQTKVKGGWERRYTCCNSDGESGGCALAQVHVCDGFDPDELRGFVKTLPVDHEPQSGDHGVYALDCEMCYTTLGLELTRVTVIDQDLKTVYESLVKPENPIIDYNTRFSGIKEEDMVEVQTSIYDVQATLLSLVHDKTILIGHSLESDFKALKVIHSTVVDTSVVFPHRMGPPKKKALKTLCREYLNKIIQESVDGHDSAEDAKACMELMRWKVRES